MTSQIRPRRRRYMNSGSLVSQLLTSPVNSPRFETNSIFGNNEELRQSIEGFPNEEQVVDPRKPSFAYYWDTHRGVNPEDPPLDHNHPVHPPAAPVAGIHSRWSDEHVKRDSVSASEFSSIRRTSHEISSRKVSKDSGIALDKSPKPEDVEKAEEQAKIDRNYRESLC